MQDFVIHLVNDTVPIIALLKVLGGRGVQNFPGGSRAESQEDDRAFSSAIYKLVSILRAVTRCLLKFR